MLFVAFLIDAAISLPVLVFASAYGALQMGVILVNTAEDYPEDLEAGITTSVISLGLHRGIALAFWLVMGGSIGVLITLLVMFKQRGVGPPWTGCCSLNTGLCLCFVIDRPTKQTIKMRASGHY
jgi:1,4-dihydroxy-2-naphthoate octaprenyltransferase